MGANKMDAEVIDRDRMRCLLALRCAMKAILAGSS